MHECQEICMAAEISWNTRQSPLANALPSSYFAPHGRSVAQPGSAPASGAGGRRFESSRSDQNPDFSCVRQKFHFTHHRFHLWQFPVPLVGTLRVHEPCAGFQGRAGARREGSGQGLSGCVDRQLSPQMTSINALWSVEQGPVLAFELELELELEPERGRGVVTASRYCPAGPNS